MVMTGGQLLPLVLLKMPVKVGVWLSPQVDMECDPESEELTELSETLFWKLGPLPELSEACGGGLLLGLLTLLSLSGVNP
jgi:hypothetical protein